MEINSINNITHIKNIGSNKTNKNRNISLNSTKRDEFIKSDHSNNGFDLYNNKISTGGIPFDKGTGAQTTVHVSRSAFDKILNETTHGEIKWEECGIDDNKRWVVVNGQRFEVEHSAEEKAMRKNASKTLLDYMMESEERMREQNKGKDNGIGKPRGNIEVLENNKEVMKLLGKIFNSTTSEGVLGALL